MSGKLLFIYYLGCHSFIIALNQGHKLGLLIQTVECFLIITKGDLEGGSLICARSVSLNPAC